jgi:hypothetical protein
MRWPSLAAIVVGGEVRGGPLFSVWRERGARNTVAILLPEFLT